MGSHYHHRWGGEFFGFKFGAGNKLSLLPSLANFLISVKTTFWTDKFIIHGIQYYEDEWHGKVQNVTLFKKKIKFDFLFKTFMFFGQFCHPLSGHGCATTRQLSRRCVTTSIWTTICSLCKLSRIIFVFVELIWLSLLSYGLYLPVQHGYFQFQRCTNALLLWKWHLHIRDLWLCQKSD